MKKIFTLILILSVTVTGLWAQTPNAGFESWTHHTSITGSYDTPDSWNTANSQTAVTGVLSCIKGTSAHSGSFSLELITKQIPAPFSQLVPGFATTGTLPSSITGPVTGGIAYTLRPDSIVGWYKYTPQGGENGFIAFDLFGSASGNSDTIAKAGFSTPAATVGTFTRFAAALTYTTTTTPVANSMWLLSSSNNDGLATSVGSILYVDDLSLVFNTTGVTEQEKPEFTISPNPVVDHVVIKNTSNAKAIFVLYDATGRKVAEEKIGNTATVVNVNTLPNGLYSYSVTDENNTAIKGGKLIIQK